MQHHNRLTRAYRNLKADQLAALAFHYMANEDELETARVADAVPLKDYRCPDVAYQARLDGFTRFAACWAIDYWRLRARRAECMSAVVATIARGERSGEVDFEQLDDLIEAHDDAERCLLALDAALVAICADYGLDPADVRLAAGAEPFKPMRDDTTADGEVRTAMESGFRQLLAA